HGSVPLTPQQRLEPTVLALAESIKIDDRRTDGAAEVAVALRDGTRHSATAWPPGHTNQPIDLLELRAKWCALWESNPHGKSWIEVEEYVKRAPNLAEPADVILGLIEGTPTSEEGLNP